jgi:hypothetical protein
MTIYKLYVKTHNKTGLNYLGTTTKEDPHKYPGSGTYWGRHLKVHGYDYTTEILHECQSKHELKEQGLYYSNMWNIVENNEWANLIPESGDGRRAPHSLDTITKIMETKRKNGTLNNSSAVASAKMLETRKLKYGTLKTNTVESIAKQLETKKKNRTMNVRTPEAIAKMLATKSRNGTFNRSPESIAKGIETRKNNGKQNQTPESIAKMVETRKKNGSYIRSAKSIAKGKETRKNNKLSRG